MILLFIVEKSPPLFMRVSGASDRVNSRQNDKHAKKGKNGRSGTGADFGGEHWPGAGRDQRPEASYTSREVERLMLRHACGFALADQGADTRLIQDYLGPPEHSAHRQVHGDQPGAVRKVV